LILKPTIKIVKNGYPLSVFDGGNVDDSVFEFLVYKANNVETCYTITH